MKTLLVVVGFLLALASSLYFIRIRSPAAAPLTLPKMFVTSGAAFVAGGGALIEPSVARKVLAEFARLPQRLDASGPTQSNPLSERELEILKLLAHGASNRQIAAQLFLAEGTVKNYVSSILDKLGAADRTQAALRARELGIL